MDTSSLGDAEKCLITLFRQLIDANETTVVRWQIDEALGAAKLGRQRTKALLTLEGHGFIEPVKPTIEGRGKMAAEFAKKTGPGRWRILPAVVRASESDQSDIVAASGSVWPEYIGAKDLASRLKRDYGSVRKILERMAKDRDCFITNESPRKGEPKILYRVKDVLSEVQSKSSIVRPS